MDAFLSLVFDFSAIFSSVLAPEDEEGEREADLRTFLGEAGGRGVEKAPPRGETGEAERWSTALNTASVGGSGSKGEEEEEEKGPLEHDGEKKSGASTQTAR